MTKKLTLGVPLAILLLSGCGQSGRHASSGPASASPVPSAVSNTSDTLAPTPQPLPAAVLAAAKPTGQQCSFDSDPNMVVGKPNTLHGWFVGPSSQPAGAFSFVLVGKADFAIPAKTGVSRPDVGAYLGNPALSAAGFAFSSTLASIPPGTYDVQLLVQQGSSAYVCDAKREIIVGPKTNKQEPSTSS